MRSPNRLRHDNCLRIIERLWRQPDRSRPELARDLHLDRSTVGLLADELVSIGVLQQRVDESPGSRGGRPPLRLRFRKGFGYAVGVELTSPVCRAVAVDLSGVILLRHEFPLESLRDDFVQGLPRVIADLENRIGRDYSEQKGLLTVGVGASGVINADGNGIELSLALGLGKPVTLVPHWRDAMKLPVYLFNDAQCSALGEAAVKQLKDLLLALVEIRSPLDIGVGLAMVLGGRLRPGRPITRLLQPESSYGDMDQFQDVMARSLSLISGAAGIKNIVLAGDTDLYADSLIPRIQDLHHLAEKGVAGEVSPLTIEIPTDGAWSVVAGAVHASVQRLLQQRLLPLPGFRVPKSA